jgi:hypothetical protein
MVMVLFFPACQQTGERTSPAVLSRRPVIVLKNNLSERFNVHTHYARPLQELTSAINFYKIMPSLSAFPDGLSGAV